MANDGLEDDTLDDKEACEIEALQHAAIVQGVTVAAIAEIFNKATSDVKKAMGNVTPSGFRAKKPLYKINDAAKYLVDPVVDIATWMKQLKPADIPPQLSREYWQGQLNKQKFEVAANHLWRTERVQAVLAEIFKITRQRILLFTDTLDQQTGLTIEQRKVIEAMADGLLADVSASIRDSFAFYEESQDRDPLLGIDETKMKATDIVISRDDYEL